MAIGARSPRVIYIMGMGRSGTTILDVLLGNCEGVVSGGELTYAIRDVMIRNVECSCGAHARECRTWSRVAQECRWTDDSATTLDACMRYVDWHTRFLLQTLGLTSKDILREYQNINQQLFAAIATISGKQIVVDSSKYPGRALALTRVLPNEVQVICVTREPVGLIAAFNKPHVDEQKPKRPLSVAAYYIYLLIAFRAAMWRLRGSVLLVKYEDLVSQPAMQVTRIAEWAGLDPRVACERLQSNAALEVGHIVTGNRLRKEKNLRFRGTSGVQSIHGTEARIAAHIMSAARRLLGFA